MSPPMQGAYRRVAVDPVPSLGPGLAAVRDGHWQIVSAPARCAPGEELGAPGPWRVVVPGIVVADLLPVWPAADDSLAAREALLAWAVATLDGVLPADAPAAPAEAVVRVTSEVGLAIEAGGRALVTRVDHDGPRLALRAALGRVDVDLPAARGAWLHAILADCRRRWRLVRCGVDAATGEIRAEVDLSGAPLALVDDLLRHTLAALRHVTAWVLPGVDLCLDRTLKSELLDHPPAGDVSGPTTDPTPPHGEIP